MMKLELPTDNLIISEIDTCFYDYYLELLTKIPSISGLCNKIVMICGSMETFKTLITGEWDEITALQTESNICEYFLVGKFYSELSVMLLEIVVDGIEIEGVRTRVRIPSAPFVFFVVVLNGQTPVYSSTTHKTSTK